MEFFRKLNRKIKGVLCVMVLSLTAVVSVFEDAGVAVAIAATTQNGQAGTEMEPTGPTMPTEPTAPTTPASPTTPTEPASLTKPSEPLTPTGPTEPASSIVPTGSTNPTEPTSPITPTGPTGSTKPTGPTNPATPTTPTKPEAAKPLFRVSVQLHKNTKYALIQWDRLKDASSYEIYRSGKKGGAYQKIAEKGAKGYKYTDKSVQAGEYYYYRVTAVRKGGKKRSSKKLAFACPIRPVSEVKLIRYSTSSIKVTWGQNKQAFCYKVYYAKKGSGKYRLAGITQNTWYRVEGLKNGQAYSFRIKACNAKKASRLDSPLSEPESMTARNYERMTVFAGDSITTGLSSYGIVNEIAIGGKKDVVASIGLNTTTFRTRREFAGLSALGKVIADHPYRAYLMIGTNEIGYRGVEDVIDGYREIIQLLKTDCPDTDVVVLAVPPVTAAKQSQSKGFAQIPALNRKLQAMAAELGANYFDYTQVLKDTNGCLQEQYAAADGIHWTVAAYRLFAAQIETYDKSLD